MKVEKELLYEYLVVIVRDTKGSIVAEVTPFKGDQKEEANDFYDKAGENWSESFLCKVLRGPKV